MLRSRDFRKRAWTSLEPRYWNAFLASLIISLLGGGTSASFGFGSGSFSSLAETDAGGLAENNELLWIIMAVLIGVLAVISIFAMFWGIFVGNPMNIGSCNFFIQNTRSAPSLIEVFHGFRVSYKRNVITMLWVMIKTFLWTCLFFIPGIIKAYEYSMIPYILADNPDISTKEAFAWSRDMMRGNKFRLFKLELSFIGWQILGLLTFGIGLIFLSPYIRAAIAEFYMEVSGTNHDLATRIASIEE